MGLDKPITGNGTERPSGRHTHALGFHFQVPFYSMETGGLELEILTSDPTRATKQPCQCGQLLMRMFILELAKSL